MDGDRRHGHIPIVAAPRPQIQDTLKPLKAAWRRFGTPALILLMALAIALTMARNWNSWEGGRIEAGDEVLSFVGGAASVQANFRETQLTNISVGNPVDVCIDMHPGEVMRGRVTEIAPASGSQFALPPPDNATGNFTKVLHVQSGGWIAEHTVRLLGVALADRTIGAAAPPLQLDSSPAASACRPTRSPSSTLNDRRSRRHTALPRSVRGLDRVVGHHVGTSTMRAPVNRCNCTDMPPSRQAASMQSRRNCRGASEAPGAWSCSARKTGLLFT